MIISLYYFTNWLLDWAILVSPYVLASLIVPAFVNGVYYTSCHGTDLIYTIVYCSMLFPTVGWPMISAWAANLAYLYMLPLCTFFPFLYHNVVIQFTLLQHCNSLWYL